jgi:mono/diheme cytochrome c family protein
MIRGVLAAAAIAVALPTLALETNSASTAAAAVAAAAASAAAPGPAAIAVVAAPAPPAADAAAVEAGRRAYVSTCARCHGINLVTTSSVFYDLRTFPKGEKERFVDSVVNGKRQMPAWGSLMKPEAIDAIWLYINKVNGW